jgi:hypothetical protein
VNPGCDVLTSEETGSIYAKAEITIPSPRPNLSIREARVSGEHLAQAVRGPKREQTRT